MARTLYVTNNTDVLAFDVRADGTTANRRDFGTLDGDDGGDGMAVDSEGRLYVTGNSGVHVLSPRGEHFGLIPTPRRPITIAFSGPDKKMLYAPQSRRRRPRRQSVGDAGDDPQHGDDDLHASRCCRRASRAGRSSRGSVVGSGVGIEERKRNRPRSIDVAVAERLALGRLRVHADAVLALDVFDADAAFGVETMRACRRLMKPLLIWMSACRRGRSSSRSCRADT